MSSAEPTGPAGIRAAGLILLALALVAGFLVYGGGDAPGPEPSAERIPVGGAGATTGGLDDAPERPMSPREAADRLFNQAIAAIEAGDTAAARPLVPMALTAYRGLEELDLDARYHVALLQIAAGRPEAARAQADTILAAHREHLLGLAVAAAAERRLGAPERAAALYRRFLDAYEVETADPRPEYATHEGSLAAAQREARSFLAAAGG